MRDAQVLPTGWPDAVHPAVAGGPDHEAEPESAESPWRRAARSLGLDEAASSLLPEAARTLLVAQMHALMEAGDYEAALEPGWLLAYDDPWNRDHALDFALCLQHLGDIQSACRFYSTALLLEAADPYCLYRLGECLEALGELDDAREVLFAAIDESRDNPAYLEVRQHAEQRLGALGLSEE